MLTRLLAIPTTKRARKKTKVYSSLQPKRKRKSLRKRRLVMLILGMRALERMKLRESKYKYIQKGPLYNRFFRYWSITIGGSTYIICEFRCGRCVTNSREKCASFAGAGRGAYTPDSCCCCQKAENRTKILTLS
jgi:hypothetical protein